jgi:hypothetical protein
MENKNRVFRNKNRGSAIVAVVCNVLLALYVLASTIVRYSEGLRSEAVDWINSWWLATLLFGGFILLAVKSLQEVFVQLTLSKEGIWYHQLGSQRFVPWKQVEGVDFIRAFLTRKKQYYLILKPESNDGQKTLFGMKQDIQEIPLSVFVERWLGSELRNEIKRLNPSLPMQEGLRNP